VNAPLISINDDYYVCIIFLSIWLLYFFEVLNIHCFSMMSVSLSIHPSGVTLVNCDHVSWATCNFIT